MAQIIWSNDEGGRQPDEREKAEAIIEEAVAIFKDHKRMAVLTGPFLFRFIEDGLPAIVKASAKYARVRIEQSYSRAKAGRK